MRTRDARYLLRFALPGLLPLFMGCATTDQPARIDARSRTGLVGTVIDESGRPIQGARIRAHFTHGIPYQEPAAETLSGEGGRFRIAGLPAGEVQVEAVEKEDRKALGAPVAIAPDTETQAGSLVIEATGELEGQVRGSAIAPLLGTSVYIPGLPYTVRTDDEGKFCLKQVPRGVYRLVAEHVSLGRVTATAIPVLPGKRTDGLVLELPGGAPRPEGVTPEWVGPGSWLDVRGLRLADPPYEPIVYLGGRRQTEVSVVSPGHVRVRVDAGTPSGKVTVQVGDFAGTSSSSVHVATAIRWEPPSPWLVQEGSVYRPHVVATSESTESIVDPWVTWSGEGAQTSSIPEGSWPLEVHLGNLVSTGVMHGSPIGPLVRASGIQDIEGPLVPLGNGVVTCGPRPVFWSEGAEGQISGRPIDLQGAPAPLAWGASPDGQKAWGARITGGALSIQELGTDGTWLGPEARVADMTPPLVSTHLSIAQDEVWTVTCIDGQGELWTCRKGETPRSWGRGPLRGAFGFGSGTGTWCGWWQMDATPPRLLLSGPEGTRELMRDPDAAVSPEVFSLPGSTWLTWPESRTSGWSLRGHEVVGGRWLTPPVERLIPTRCMAWTMRRSPSTFRWAWSDSGGLWMATDGPSGPAESPRFMIHLGGLNETTAISIDERRRVVWWLEQLPGGSMSLNGRPFLR